MSWIHIQDWINFTIDSIQNEKYVGAYNLTAPNPVSQKKLVQTLVKARNIPLALWAPKIAVQTALGELSQVILTSQKVFPKKALNEGFQFQFPEIDQAMSDIYQNEDYLVQNLSVAQFIPSDVGTVFNFFSEAKNLEKITPDFLNFKVEKMSTSNIQKNTIIDYKLKIHGFPAKWQTEITDWLPNKKFVDFQNKGPYSLWHHTHSFTQVKEGTLIEDRVKYKIPGHLVGLLFLGAFIKKDVTAIFKYRISIIKNVFKGS
jgi:ligand-binding SRPBCC domain-containing protein